MPRKLLTDRERFLLENPKELYTDEYERPQTRGKFFSDRRDKINECIKYLEFMAKHLPDSQLKQVFNRQTLGVLIHTILEGESDVWKRLPHYRSPKGNRIKNPRIFNVATMLITEGEAAAWQLLPTEEVTMLMTDRKYFDKARIIRTLSLFMKEG